MALYEFQCKKCRRKTEVIQRFSDPAPTKCPHCGGALAKLLSSPAVQFKGSGFYVTDYGRPGEKLENLSRGKEGDSKEKDSSKSKEGSGGSPGDAGAGTKGDSEGAGGKDSGDSSKEKKDSKDSSKRSSDAAKDAGQRDSAASPLNKSSKRK